MSNKTDNKSPSSAAISLFRKNLENCFDDICASVIIALPPHGEIISVNLETEELTGYEADELIGTNLSDIFSAEDKPRIQSLFDVSNVENLDFKRVFEHNIIIQKRSKRKILVDMGIKLKNHNDFTAFVFTLQDITDLKKTQIEIEKAHKYLDSILTSMTEGLFVVDQQGKIKTVNKSAQTLLKAEHNQLINQDIVQLFKTDSAFCEITACKEFETELKSTDGSYTPALVLSSPLRTSEYSEEHHVIVVIDMTERKKAEKLIAEQQMMLAQSSKMSALGVMASGIAHEINNPLHIINGNCEILSMILNESPIDTSGLSDSINVISSMTGRIDKIVAGLSSFSRDDGGDPMEMKSIQEIVKATLLLCETRIQNAGISFYVPEIDKKLETMCHPTQVSQVLLNLLNNAYDEVRNHESPKIELQLTYDQDYIFLLVANSGDKISTATAEKIFNPFYTTKPVGEGTGLGLSISKSIMEKHGGDLYVDFSKPTTTFVVQLPKKSIIKAAS